MNWKRVLTRANLIWFEIGLAVLLGLFAATQVLALPQEGGVLAQRKGIAEEQMNLGADKLRNETLPGRASES